MRLLSEHQVNEILRKLEDLDELLRDMIKPVSKAKDLVDLINGITKILNNSDEYRLTLEQVKEAEEAKP